jgi:hypothetical protein
MTDDKKQEKGVFMKYKLEKADGSPVDSDACYFILRLDKDKAARIAARTYAAHCGNDNLRDDIYACCDWLDNPPACTCGGRDMDITCSFHDGPSRIHPHPVWR